MVEKSKTIGVLMGGLSAERDISLGSGQTVVEALTNRGYRALPMIVDASIDEQLRSRPIDVAFNALHGTFGEDGCIQGLLEMRRIPYTGSGVLASALSMDKLKAKEIFRLHNLPTPSYYVVDETMLGWIEREHGAFGFPAIVKPRRQGSSLGVSLVHDLPSLRSACHEALEFDNCALVERYIPGKEICVGILGGRALGALEVVPGNHIFDYQAKYVEGYAHYRLPARLSAERQRGVLTQALRAHQALGCSGATRVDMIVSELGNEYILEVNSVPGLLPKSLLPRVARQAGLSYESLIEEILNEAKLHINMRPLEPTTDMISAAPSVNVAVRHGTGAAI